MGRDVGHGLGLGLGSSVRVVIDKRVFYLPSEIIHLAQIISSAVNAAVASDRRLHIPMLML